VHEKECLPVKKKVCSPIPSYLPFYHDDVCDTEYETICTTILATKYVKECKVSRYNGFGEECSEYPVQKPVKKCAQVPKQSCIKRRSHLECKHVTKQLCRKVSTYKAIEKCENATGEKCSHVNAYSCLKTENICQRGNCQN